VRLRIPVVAGEPTSGSLTTMTLSDFGIAVGWEPSPTGAAFINPDVTVQINRYPIGVWVLMDSRVHASRDGVGFCETVLSDDRGPFGRVLQTLVEAPESFTFGMPTVPFPNGPTAS
jgi:Acyl-CoA thioesterase C-terminal domain